VNQTCAPIVFSASHITQLEKRYWITLEEGGRSPFHWKDTTKPELARFSSAHSATENWSQSFSISDAGTISVFTKPPQGRQKFFKVTKRNVLNSMFVIIQDMKQPPYKIVNNCKDITVKYA